MSEDKKDAAYWKTYWATREEESKARQSQQGAELYATLSAQGVATVAATYYGGGDQGCVLGITYKDADDKEMTLSDTKQLEETIDEFVCSFLPDGWEINQGSYGTAIMNVAERNLKFQHFVERKTEWEVEWPTPTITP